jgi:hypothetical protein
MLLEAAPSLIRSFGSGEQSEKNAKAAEKVVDIAKQVTGQSTAEAAVESIQNDPVMREAFDKEARAQFLEIESLVDKRVTSAREFSKGEQPLFGQWKFVHILSMMVVFAAILGIGYVLTQSEDATERAMALQALLLVGFGGIMSFWMGSSSSSKNKDDAIEKAMNK